MSDHNQDKHRSMKAGDTGKVTIEGSATSGSESGYSRYTPLSAFPTVEIYEGDLLITAHQAMEVLSRKVGLQYAAGEGNDVYLIQIADAMLTTLKKQNSHTDIVVRRKP